jgi:hypothetical protein
MKQFRIALLSTILIMGFTPGIASGATVKNGVTCSKLGSTIKSAGKNYRCGKNPFFKPTKLTWTLQNCFKANALLRSSKMQYEDFKDIAKLAGADGEKAMNDLLISIAELETTMKNEACKKGA